MRFDVFPVTWRWTTVVAGAHASSSDDVTLRIQRALIAEGAKATVRDPKTVEFACPGLTGMSRWALLAPISSGYVSVESLPDALRLTCALRFTLTFWFSLVVTGAFWLLEHRPSLSLSLFTPFAVLFGGNVATSLWRFPGFLRRVVAPGPSTSPA